MPLFIYQFIGEHAQLLFEQPDLQLGSYFWQIIATVFGTITVWMVKRDLAKRDQREEKNMEAISTLRTQVAVLANDVEGMRADLDRLIAKKK